MGICSLFTTLRMECILPVTVGLGVIVQQLQSWAYRIKSGIDGDSTLWIHSMPINFKLLKTANWKVVVKNTKIKSNFGRKGYVLSNGSWVTVHHSSLRGVRAWTEVDRWWRMKRCCASSGWLHCLSYTDNTHLPRDSATGRGLGPPTSNSNQEVALTDMLTGQPKRGMSSAESPSFHGCLDLCEVANVY